MRAVLELEGLEIVVSRAKPGAVLTVEIVGPRRGGPDGTGRAGLGRLAERSGDLRAQGELTGAWKAGKAHGGQTR